MYFSEDDIPLRSLTSSTLVNGHAAADDAETGNQSDSQNVVSAGHQSGDDKDQSQDSESQPLLFLSSSDEDSDKENGESFRYCQKVYTSFLVFSQIYMIYKFLNLHIGIINLFKNVKRDVETQNYCK